MTALVELEPEVLSEAPEVDAIALRRAILHAVRDFCERTLVLETTTDPYLDVVAGQAVYTLPSVPNRTIVKIKRNEVWWGTDRQIVHRSEDQLDLDVGNPHVFLIAEEHNALASLGNLSQPWRAMTAAIPSFYYQPAPNRIRLVPIPNAAAAAKLGVTYHLKPSISATEVDDFVVENWYQILSFGALAELLGMRDKRWTDPVRATKYRADFDAGIDKVIRERVSGFASNDYAVGRVRAWT